MPSPALLEGVHAITTPELVEFDFVLAGLYRRCLAWLIDTAVVIGLTVLLALGVGFISVAVRDFGGAAFFIGYFLVDWGYAIALEASWAGQTVGKRVLGIRVVRESGVRIGAYAAILRNLARPVDRLPILYLVGATSALLTGSQQRLGDLLAGTVVVRDRRLKIPTALPPDASDAPLLADPLFAQRVTRLTADEREWVFSAVLRREELGLEARLTLYSVIARRLEQEHDLIKPAHFSDEKMILCVAAALLARSRAERTALSNKTKARW